MELKGGCTFKRGIQYIRLTVSKLNWKVERGMNGTKEGKEGARKSEGRKWEERGEIERRGRKEGCNWMLNEKEELE